MKTEKTLEETVREAKEQLDYYAQLYNSYGHFPLVRVKVEKAAFEYVGIHFSNPRVRSILIDYYHKRKEELPPLPGDHQ